MLIALLLLAQSATGTAVGATPKPAPVVAAPEAAPAASSKNDSRIFGILPNYRSTSVPQGQATRITAKDKFMMALKDSADPGAFVITTFYAGLAQGDGQYLSFGGGMRGFGRRYGMMLVDGFSGTYLTEAVFPAVFRQDPRYFRLGQGTTFQRVRYSLGRLVLARCDSGRTCFNYGEIGGNLAQTYLANVYYPRAERSTDNAALRLTLAIGSDGISNLVKEFWPDLEQSRTVRRIATSRLFHLRAK